MRSATNLPARGACALGIAVGSDERGSRLGRQVMTGFSRVASCHLHGHHPPSAGVSIVYLAAGTMSRVDRRHAIFVEAPRKHKAFERAIVHASSLVGRLGATESGSSSSTTRGMRRKRRMVSVQPASAKSMMALAR
jgi:hypothetical protein